MRIFSHFKISDAIGISLGLNLVKIVYLVEFFSVSLHYDVGPFQRLDFVNLLQRGGPCSDLKAQPHWSAGRFFVLQNP